jgi:hypothetical protein
MTAHQVLFCSPRQEKDQQGEAETFILIHGWLKEENQRGMIQRLGQEAEVVGLQGPLAVQASQWLDRAFEGHGRTGNPTASGTGSRPPSCN